MSLLFRCGLIMIGLALFFSCGKNNEGNSHDLQDNTMVTITGIAQNGKDGALVLTADRKVYYLDGINAWNETVLSKQVGVSGKLRVENFSEENLINENGERKAGLAGDKLTIIDAKWRILETK